MRYDDDDDDDDADADDDDDDDDDDTLDYSTTNLFNDDEIRVFEQ